jgi:DNA-binding winged helix-turn-helix (wHTH) protein
VLKQGWTTQQRRDDPMHRWDRPSLEPHEINSGDDAVIRFRRFSLLPRARQLLADGRPVELGSRALDLLIALLRAPGTLVTKDEIVNHVWPSTRVEESNLRVQMAALRRALGKDRDVIKTIPGRGYVFTAEVATGSVEVAVMPAGSMKSELTSPQEAVRATIIVIDDDRALCEALYGILRSAGLRVELFASVQAFLDGARAALPGCAVLDARRFVDHGELDTPIDRASGSLASPQFTEIHRISLGLAPAAR